MVKTCKAAGVDVLADSLSSTYFSSDIIVNFLPSRVEPYDNVCAVYQFRLYVIKTFCRATETAIGFGGTTYSKYN